MSLTTSRINERSCLSSGTTCVREVYDKEQPDSKLRHASGEQILLLSSQQNLSVELSQAAATKSEALSERSSHRLERVDVSEL